MYFKLQREEFSTVQQASTSSHAIEHVIATEEAQESLDPESTNYIQEMKGSWNQVNLIHRRDFEDKAPPSLNQTISDKNWIKTTSESFGLQWIADTAARKVL